MDVSSRYFSKLRHPGPYWIAYLWRFFLTIHRVGKLHELISFVLWETAHRIRIYRVGSQYVEFTNTPFFSLGNDGFLPLDTINANPFLTDSGLCFQPAAVDWQYCVEMNDGTTWGSCFANPNALYVSQNQRQLAVVVHEFSRPITSLFVSRQNALFVCSDGRVYRSDDRGKSFDMVLRLSTPISYFLFNRGMTELPDRTLLIGEYGSIWHGRAWQNLAYVYYSTDGGDTWQTADFLLRQGVNKHVHLVQYSALLEAVFLMDGDNKKQAWINTSLSDFDEQAGKQKSGWQLLNKHHHQTGGYMCMAETSEAVLFGSDYLGGTNFIVSTTDGKRFSKLVMPDPYRRSPIMNMVVRQSAAGSEVWAVSYSCLTGKAKSLLMCSKDSGKSWVRVIEFDGTKHEIRFASSAKSPEFVYVSLTEFGNRPGLHQHRVYELKAVAPACNLREVPSSNRVVTPLLQRVPQHVPI